MTYGTIKVDTVTFTDAGVDKSVTLSGLVQNPTFSGNVTVTGTLSGVTVTGTTANFTSGNFTNISGGTHTITSGVFAAGSAASPSITFTGDLNTGIYSPGADQVAISTGGTQRLLIDASGNVNIDSNTFYVDAINNRVAIGTTDPQTALDVRGEASIAYNATYGLRFYNQDRNNWSSIGNNIATGGTSANLVFKDSTGEVARMTGGRLLVGTSSSPSAGAGQYALSVVQGYAGGATGEGIVSIARGKVATAMANTDTIGQILFTDNAGNTFSKIISFVDGTVSSTSDLPGALSFSTTADGASSPTERMRIAANGQMTHFLNGTTNAANLILNVGGVGDPGNSGWITPRIDFVGSSLASSGTTFIGATGALGGRSLVFATGSDGTGSERARIDSSGRLLVGTSSASYSSTIVCQGNSGSSSGEGIVRLNRGAAVPTSGQTLGAIIFGQSAGNDGAYILGEADAAWSASNDYPTRLVFSTTADGESSPTERMRITNSGYFKASNTGSYADSSGASRASSAQHFFRNDANDITVLATSVNTGSGVESFTSDMPSTASASACHFIGAVALSRTFIVSKNGNVTNTNNSYGAISDAKLKENIVDASSQWDDIKALQVRKYNFKEGQTHTQIGLVAQEVELVSPGLVSKSPDRDAEGNDLNTVTKSVNYSVLYMKAVKALQEAMERIETLEAKVAALENA